MSHLVGAYVCPRGVFAVECKVTRAGMQILRSFGVSEAIENAGDATARLVRMLEEAGIRRANVAIALRGFGVVHHVLALPPAPDNLLATIIDREIRRLEPQLDDAVVSWLALPKESATDAPPHKQLLVGGAPRETVDAVELGIQGAGHHLLHLTLLPAVFQRLHDEFVANTDAIAVVSPLPDGAFLAFFLEGGLRLVVEPPLSDQEQPHDATAIAEEAELGAMFVRQQFRGAQISRVIIAASAESFSDPDAAFAQRLGVPVERLAVTELGSGELAALGAALDSRSAAPLALAGKTRERGRATSRSRWQAASYAALVIVALLGTFVMIEAMRARDAARALQDARRRIEQESFGMMPLRETADQRKLIRDAITALQFVARDRRELQQTLGAIGSTALNPVRLDSVRLDRGSNGWIAQVGGSIRGETNARAVQMLHDFYQDLPRRMRVEELSLEQLAYADSSGASGSALITFQLSFVVPEAKRN